MVSFAVRYIGTAGQLSAIFLAAKIIDLRYKKTSEDPVKLIWPNLKEDVYVVIALLNTTAACYRCKQ